MSWIHNLIIAGISMVAVASTDAAVVLYDDFSGDADDAPDAALWISHPNTKLDGSGAVHLVAGADPVLRSVDTYLYETLEFKVNSNEGNNTLGFYGNGANWIYIRSDQGVAQVYAGVAGWPQTTLSPWPSSYTAKIEWAADDIKIWINGNLELHVTNPAHIPQVPMYVKLHHYGDVGYTDVDWVQVGVVPEPATLSLAAVASAAMLRRRRF